MKIQNTWEEAMASTTGRLLPCANCYDPARAHHHKPPHHCHICINRKEQCSGFINYPLGNQYRGVTKVLLL